MDAALTEHFQALLLEQAERIDAEHRLALQSAATVVLDPTRVGRLTRLDAMQQQAMAQASVQQQLLHRRRIAAALDRLHAGRYGPCFACGGEVGSDRLRSHPAPPFCLDCQAEHDAAR